MDKELLVKSGSKLVELLDDTKAKSKFAMWVLHSDSGAWKLWLVPENESLDVREFYGAVSRTMVSRNSEIHGLDIGSVELADSKNPVVQQLASTFNFVGGEIHLSNNSYNGFYLPEGILLRSYKLAKAA